MWIDDDGGVRYFFFKKCIWYKKCFVKGMLLFSVVKVCNYLFIYVFVNYFFDVGMVFIFLFVCVVILNDWGMCKVNYLLYIVGVIYVFMVFNFLLVKSINIFNILEYIFLIVVFVYFMWRLFSN